MRVQLLIFSLYLRRNWRSISFIVFLIAFLLWGFIYLRLLTFTNNLLTEGMIGTYQEHDLPLEITRLLSSPLVDIDASGKNTPGLVSGWEVSQDATFYKFYLKDNLYWADGTKLKASDIDLNFPNVEINTPDDVTITFKLSESYSPFPSLLDKPIFKKVSRVGVGPYQIQTLEKSRVFITKLTLSAKNKDLPDISVRFYPNDKTAQTGFALGEVSTLLGLSPSFDAVSIKNISKIDYTKIVTVFFNTQDDLLSNRSIRQALSFSTPVIQNETVAKKPYPPFSWAINTESKDYLDNAEEAELALERAKNNVSDEIFKKELTLTTVPQLEEVGKKIVTSWRELGINAVLRVESGLPQKFQALLITQSLPSDPDQYFLWHESQKSTNLSKYSQKRVDKNLEEGRKIIKDEERKIKYQDFQKVLLEDAPAVFLYFPKYNVYFYNSANAKINKVLPMQLSNLQKN